MELKIYKEQGGYYDLQGDGVAIYDLTYADRSERNRLDLYLPTQEAERYPVVVFVHGGGFYKSDKSHHLSNILNVLPFGYAAVAINFRLTLVDGVVYPDIRSDVIDALNFLAAHPRIDSDRIILWGESHGAWMTNEIMVSHRDELPFSPAGVISFYAPIDLVDYVSWKVDHNKTFFIDGIDNDTYFFGCDGQAMLDAMAAHSILDKVTEDLPPYFLLHGEKDDEIPSKYTYEFDEALTRAGVAHRTYIVEGGEHGIDNYMNAEHNAPVIQFVDDVFKGKAI